MRSAIASARSLKPVHARRGREREDAAHGAERDDEPLVADLERAGDALDRDRPRGGVERGHAAEHEVGVRAHLAKRDDDVARLERARRRFGQERRVQHRVLRRDDRRPALAEEACHIGAGEAAAEHERPAERVPLHLPIQARG